MSDRERWIVYPLLFLSLGLTLKPKFTHELEVPHIHCRSITCGDEDGGKVVRLNSGAIDCRALTCGEEGDGNYLRLETGVHGPMVNFHRKGLRNEDTLLQIPISTLRSYPIGMLQIRSDPPPAPKTPPITPSNANAKKPRPPEPPNGE